MAEEKAYTSSENIEILKCASVCVSLTDLEDEIFLITKVLINFTPVGGESRAAAGKGEISKVL